MAGRLSRGDIHLYKFVRPDKQRPVVVLTRDSAIAHLATVTLRRSPLVFGGVPSEVVLDIEDGLKSRCAVNLHNTVTVSQMRLGRRVASLSATRIEDICAALRFSLGCS